MSFINIIYVPSVGPSAGNVAILNQLVSMNLSLFPECLRFNLSSLACRETEAPKEKNLARQDLFGILAIRSLGSSASERFSFT